MDEIIGKKFNRLTIKEKIEERKRGCIQYRCICDCGNEYNSTLTELKRGDIKSCGCYKRDYLKEKLTTHGMSSHYMNRKWRAIKNRCYNKKTDRYKDYGGRGIIMCEEWKDSFEQFYEDMGERPSPDYTLDRIDNDGPYAPWNCKWSDSTEQAINKRYLKESSSGEKNISLDGNMYSCRISRYKHQRTCYTSDLEDAVKIRDLWLKEYKEDKDKWIEDTINNTYKKSV